MGIREAKNTCKQTERRGCIRGDCKQTTVKGSVNSGASASSMINGSVFFLENLFNSLFHSVSPAGSDFCVLLLFRNFYSFEIFSRGNSARTGGEEKERHGN